MLVFRTALLDIPREKKYTSIKWGGGELTWSAPGYDIGEINPFRYRSYYYDTETGLYYLQSRYYDPVVGRFINADDTTVIPQASTISNNKARIAVKGTCARTRAIMEKP